MKKTITIIAMLSIALGTVFATGNRTKKAESIKLIPAQNQMYYLIYPFKDYGKVKIRFTDENGKKLGSDIVWNKVGFKKAYDLSSLREGRYQVEIVDSEGTVSKQIEIKTELEAAVLKLKQDRYRLLMDAKDDYDVGIKIFDDKHDLLFSSYQQTKSARIYDLSKFRSKNFTFELAYNGKHRNIVTN